MDASGSADRALDAGADAQVASDGGSTAAESDASESSLGMNGEGGAVDAEPPSQEEASTSDSEASVADAEVADAGPDEAPPMPCHSAMLPGERLYQGEYLCSDNGLYRFGLSLQGELELRGTDTVLWNAGVCCSGYRVSMQHDGNLVVRDEQDEPLFSSKTHGMPGTWLRLSDDGRASLRFEGEVIWSTRP